MSREQRRPDRPPTAPRCHAPAEGPYPGPLELEFDGEVIRWRGPAPYHFLTVPDNECAALKAASPLVSYGWGVIPVTAQVGGTGWTTSLFPKDGRYLVPVRDAVRKAETLEVGETVRVRLIVRI